MQYCLEKNDNLKNLYMFSIDAIIFPNIFDLWLVEFRGGAQENEKLNVYVKIKLSPGVGAHACNPSG